MLAQECNQINGSCVKTKRKPCDDSELLYYDLWGLIVNYSPFSAQVVWVQDPPTGVHASTASSHQEPLLRIPSTLTKTALQINTQYSLSLILVLSSCWFDCCIVIIMYIILITIMHVRQPFGRPLSFIQKSIHKSRDCCINYSTVVGLCTILESVFKSAYMTDSAVNSL